MDVDYAELNRRISGRRTCRACGKVFNVHTSPPPPGETCPKTGAAHELYQRPDDKEETVAERLRVYEEKTRPLVSFYASRGLLRRIDAHGEVDEVTRRLQSALAGASSAGEPGLDASPRQRSTRHRHAKRRAAGARAGTKRRVVKRAARKPARRKHKRAAAPARKGAVGKRRPVARKPRTPARARRRR